MAYTAKRVVAMMASMPDQVGLLAMVAKMWKADDVDMLAAAAWVEDQAMFLGVPKDPEAGRKCAAKQGVTLKETPAIYIEGDDEMGALQPVAQEFARAGINLEMTQAISVHGKFAAVLMVGDADYEKACAALGI